MEENKEIMVDTTKTEKGTVTFLGKGLSNPPPSLLSRATKALRYFCTCLITMVSATDLFSGGQVKIIAFILGTVILSLGAVDIAIGVVPDKENNK